MVQPTAYCMAFLGKVPTILLSCFPLWCQICSQILVEVQSIFESCMLRHVVTIWCTQALDYCASIPPWMRIFEALKRLISHLRCAWTTDSVHRSIDSAIVITKFCPSSCSLFGEYKATTTVQMCIRTYNASCCCHMDDVMSAKMKIAKMLCNASHQSNSSPFLAPHGVGHVQSK